jgi:hypothetical protein
MERRGFLGSIAAFMAGTGAATIKPLPYIDEIREKEREGRYLDLDQPLDPPEFNACSGVLMDLADRDIISHTTACSGIIPDFHKWRDE